MIEPTELDIAEMKHNMRQLYKDKGFEVALQALYEIMWGARMLAEVIMEERAKEQ